jgi:thiamine-monophosphate kinase
MNEFSLIKKFFQDKTTLRDDVVLGIGDDGALLRLPQHELLVVVMDTMVAGVHFPLNTSAYDIGYKALAVNLSDLAAMGATPAWFTLALTIPEANEQWLSEFTDGLFDLAKQFNLQLVGGDTTRGPLTITIQAHGFVPENKALHRAGARQGDKIYLSGTVGDAGLGLIVATNNVDLPDSAREYALHRLNRPEPRVQLGLLLRDFASSAIDISDGLLADLQHILTASRVGAQLYSEHIPLSAELRASIPYHQAVKLALTAGDDYELCFTIPHELENDLLARLASENISCQCIGVVTSDLPLKLDDEFVNMDHSGYLHFMPNVFISSRQSENNC